MKHSIFVAMTAAIFLLLILASAVIAQDEPPAPYTGLKNPFPWDDNSVQRAGKEIYQRSCLGCHGVDGGNIANSDFSTADYPVHLEERPDFYFWLLSEGRLDKGMPPFKSSLSEEQRWQALTYTWSLSQTVPPTASEPPPTVENGALQLSAPEQAQAGQPLTLSAVLQDSQGAPVGNAPVKFFVEADFFTSGLVEIGEAFTDENGAAVLSYTPRRVGEMKIIARHQAIEATARLSLTGTDEYFYHTEAGIRVPSPGREIAIGPEVDLKLGAGGEAPPPIFRLPTGRLAWLAPLLFTAMAIWIVYFYVLYQVFRIPARAIITSDTRRLPLIGLAIVTLLGTLLVLMLVTGPESNPHLFP